MNYIDDQLGSDDKVMSDKIKDEINIIYDAAIVKSTSRLSKYDSQAIKQAQSAG